MKGFVATPAETVDTMVALLFQGTPPRPSHRVLDPGCGTGQFIDGIIRWCERRGLPLPQIVGVESDPRHIPSLHSKYSNLPTVQIHHADFLGGAEGSFNFVVGNPPYVPITALSETEKAEYRHRFSTARGRFDLYMLFFEQSLRMLSPGGRLVFITPEKYLYVDTASPLRELLAKHHVEEIRLFPEDTFGQLVTYPTITVIRNTSPSETRIFRRDGSMFLLKRVPSKESWLPFIEGAFPHEPGSVLGDLCLRISCGVATGADAVFVRPAAGLNRALLDFAHPTIAGRELTPKTIEIPQRFVMLIPYDANGRLLPIARLGALRRYLERPEIRERLLARTCARVKPWYAFHETPALKDIICPKILCKDINDSPRFWVDRTGITVPRHSVYYIVPRDPSTIDAIADYLRSPAAHDWLAQNCQRAAKGFLRLQSRTLQRLPIPPVLAGAVPGALLQPRATTQPSTADVTYIPRPPDAHTI